MAKFRKVALRSILIGICIGLSVTIGLMGLRIIYQVNYHYELEKNSSYLFSQILDSSSFSNR